MSDNGQLTEHVLERLLIAKGLLSKIRFAQVPERDRITLANYILTSHDAAELAIAAIAQHLGKSPKETQSYLMNYFAPIEETHPGRSVKGRKYFSNLNDVRNGIKHKGLFPDQKDWKRVGLQTWDYVSDWCAEYLGITLESLDQSALISDPNVKEHYANAQKEVSEGRIKDSLESLALACHALFSGNRALRRLAVGAASAEDAIKLSTYGVHANDYLALQEFLPRVAVDFSQEKPAVVWEQLKYGHPANWTKTNAEFCLRAFVELALRIQDADWIPGAFLFDVIYQYKITALSDDVKIFQEKAGTGLINPAIKFVVKTLRAGEFIRCATLTHRSRIGLRILGEQEGTPTIQFHGCEDGLWGEMETDKVCITCIPYEYPVIKEYFPDLTEIPYQQ